MFNSNAADFSSRDTNPFKNNGDSKVDNKVGYHDAGLIDIGGFMNNFRAGNYGKAFKF